MSRPFRRLCFTSCSLILKNSRRCPEPARLLRPPLTGIRSRPLRQRNTGTAFPTLLMPNGSLKTSSVLQIVPREPGSHDGVGDYALSLAHCLLRDHNVGTTFVVAQGSQSAEKEGFPVRSALASISSQESAGVIVHY